MADLRSAFIAISGLFIGLSPWPLRGLVARNHAVKVGQSTIRQMHKRPSDAMRSVAQQAKFKGRRSPANHHFPAAALPNTGAAHRRWPRSNNLNGTLAGLFRPNRQSVGLGFDIRFKWPIHLLLVRGRCHRKNASRKQILTFASMLTSSFHTIRRFCA